MLAVWSLTKECWVEPNTKLSNEIISFCGSASLIKFGQEVTSPRLGNGAQIFYEIILCHSNTRICDVQDLVFFVSLVKKYTV